MSTSRKVVLPLLFALFVFLTLYSSARNLPVLGDGTFHAYIMEEMAGSGSLSIDAQVPYPPSYHLFGAMIELCFGASGLKWLSPLMAALCGLLVYLIAKRLTDSEFVALTSLALLAFSSKVILYSAQVLMEPFMCFFVLLGIYSVLLFRQRRDMRALVFMAVAVSLAVITKQQAIFLLFAVLALLLLSRMGLRKCVALILLTAILAVGPYLYLWHSTGTLVAISPIGSISNPVHDSYVIHLGARGSLLDRVLFRIGRYEIPQWSRELDEESDGLELYDRGTSRAESRHIYVWDMVNPAKFVELNSLQLGEFVKRLFDRPDNIPPPVYVVGFGVLQILLIVGFVLMVIRSASNRRWRVVLFIVGVSWLFTFMGTDTARYFLYLPMLLAFTYPLCVGVTFARLRKMWGWKRRVALIGFCVMLAFAILYLYQERDEAQDHIRRMRNTQCYRPCEGGIASIREVGNWVRDNSDEGDIVFGTSIYEWTYYCEREAFWDYRVYFLSPDRIDHYLRLWKIKYVLVRESQMLPDGEWNHIEYYPQCFWNSISAKYELVYISPYDDIWVYEVA